MLTFRQVIRSIVTGGKSSKDKFGGVCSPGTWINQRGTFGTRLKLIIFMHKWPLVQYPRSGRTDRFEGLGQRFYVERAAISGSLGA
jgi:hypothetical protein